ncbi:hypothetical protein E2C01_085278 [Portunus trituberculatus]|uniref:Uncharacterized protein n=1 Tax=Portunus trituberculatus TaxID=210409 RepID=A0A5B7J0J0_PORTR|nr:hypothetical protein [Portunus trituberculatus]
MNKRKAKPLIDSDSDEEGQSGSGSGSDIDSVTSGVSVVCLVGVVVLLDFRRYRWGRGEWAQLPNLTQLAT